MTTQHKLIGDVVHITTTTTVDFRSINFHSAYQRIQQGIWNDEMFRLWMQWNVDRAVTEAMSAKKEVFTPTKGDLIAVRDVGDSRWAMRHFHSMLPNGRVLTQEDLDGTCCVVSWNLFREATIEEIDTSTESSR